MKLGRNLLAGLLHSVWSTVVGLAVVPVYLKLLGVEAYGLIGFFAAMQALLALFDMGLSPTMNREVARCSATQDYREARRLLHTLALIYWAMAAGIAVVSYLLASFIATYWLRASAIPVATVAEAVALMGVIVACRWPLGLYLGALMGAQRLTTASYVGIAMSTLASLGAVGVLVFIETTIQAFFIWQAIAGLIHVLVIRWFAWSALGARRDVGGSRFDIAGLKRIWRFSAGMGATALLGTIFMQSDKIILSKIVSLEELGQYALAGLAARSLYLFLTPVFSAVYPRMTALVATDNMSELVGLYKSGTRVLMAAIFPLAAYVAVFSTEIFTLWTGDRELAIRVDVIVDLLLLGTALNGAMHFPYALQLSYGRADLPVVINMVLIVVFAPLIAFLSIGYGAVGGAAAWAILNALYLFLGTWLTHRKLLPGIGTGWLIGDVGLPLLTSIVIVGIGSAFLRSLTLHSHVQMILGVLLMAMAFAIVIGLSPPITGYLRQALKRRAATGAVAIDS